MVIRDDGLAVLKSATGSESERIRKRLVKTFQAHGLSHKTNITSSIFLEITMNLRTESYKPFRKPNNQHLYIHKHSNHPSYIIKTLPETSSKRISTLSSTKKYFKQAAPFFNEELKQVEHNYKIKFTKEDHQKKTKKT